MRKKIFGILGISEEDWFYSKWAILFWLRCKKEKIEITWLWTRVLAASSVIIPIFNLKWFSQERKRKKRRRGD